MLGSNPRSRRRPARRRWLSLAAVGLLLVVSLIPLNGVRADNPGDGQLIPAGQFQTLAPIENVVSGSMWTVIHGLGPIPNPVSTDPGAAGFDYSGPGLAAANGNGNGNGGLDQQVPARNPAPSFSRNVIVTRQTGYAPFNTEPSIAVDPTDPNHIVLGTIDYNSPTAMATYVSFDGGETWTGPNSIRFFREDYAGAGDPVVTFDSQGTVYLSFISVGFEQFYIGTIASYSEVSSMVVTKSLDGGLTWNDPVSAARGVITTVSNVDSQGKERGTVTFPFLDKPWITVGPSPADPSKEVLYLTYTDFESTYGLIYSDEVPYLSSPATETTIRMVKSEDGGDTWSAPVAVSPTVLQALQASAPGVGGSEGAVGDSAAGGDLSGSATSADTGDGSGSTQVEQQQGSSALVSANRTVQGSQPKVLPDGTLVIAYLDSTDDGAQEGLFTVQVNISKDGGKTFAGPQTAGIFREPHEQPRNTSFRYWGSAFPQLAVGPKGEIYIATTALPPDKPTDDGDIYLMRSLDSGKTWKSPLRINTDKTSRLQFFPSIAVSPDGVVHIMWGDMRDDPQELRYNVYYSESKDQGATWGFSIPDQSFTAPDTRVSDFASDSLKGFPGGAFIGDYFSLAATKGEVYMVWADTRLGEFNGYDQQIAFARQEAIKPPQLYLNPPSGSAGRVVQIQGFGFEPQSNILLLVSGEIVSNERTDDKGQFQTSIYMPLTGEGPTNISAFDETGNAATAAFYTEFGFDSLQKELDQIDTALQLSPVGSAPGSPIAVSPSATTSPPPVSSPSPSASASATATKGPARTPTGTPTPAKTTNPLTPQPQVTSAFGPLPTATPTGAAAKPSPTPTATPTP